MSISPQGFSPFPTLHTPRLVLRQLNDKDVPQIFFLRSDPGVNRFIERTPLVTHNEAQAFINRINQGIEDRTFLYWAVCLKGSKSLIGTICLWNFNDDYTEAEMGYELYPSYHRKGIMSEAMAAVIHHGFLEVRLYAIEAFTHHLNEASTRLLDQHGFELQPERKDADVPSNAIYRLEQRLLAGT